MAGTAEHDGADVIPVGLWVDDLLSTELDLQAPADAVFDRHTVTIKPARSADEAGNVPAAVPRSP
jgi:hypothetical protein